ncbi:MAG: hypothetical protein LC802_16475 [Acidobacteria bacterium]|nr:hypothetical protein [Acidobacteriota bacterium]
MRRLLLHLGIALIAFVIGITTAMMFGVFSGPREAQAPCAPVVQFEPPPPGAHGHFTFTHELPPLPPLPPALPAAPLPPEPVQKTRIVIRRGDGSVQVIESQTEKRAEHGKRGS